MGAIEFELTLAPEFAYQLVFRCVLDRPLQLRPPGGAEFVMLAGPADALRRWRALARRFGVRALPKVIAKLATPSRVLFAVVQDGALAHHGWLSVSRCPFYPFAKGDVVVGPTGTMSSMRGRGLASYGLQQAMNVMYGRGHRVFYANISPANIASQKVGANCGFSGPIAAIITRRSGSDR